MRHGDTPKHRWLAAVTLAGGLFAGGHVDAQENADGRVSGTAAPGQALLLESLDRGLRRRLVPDRSGRFDADGLAPGRYRLTQGGQQREFELDIGSHLRLQLDTTDTASVPLETIVVEAGQRGAYDQAQLTDGFTVAASDLNRLPAARTLTGAAVLAPGTVEDRSGFSDLTSFGGSTVAENQYYLNGFNLSDLRSRLSPAGVPYAFLDRFQVLTGGYSAAFGRATGGVVNAVTRRGGPQWQGQIESHWEPAWGRAQKRSVSADGLPLYDYRPDRFERWATDLSGGGPLIPGRLHAFGVASWVSSRETSLMDDDYTLAFQRGDFRDRTALDAPLAALSVDWQLADGHDLTLTGFRDAATQTLRRARYDRIAGAPASDEGTVRQRSGGDAMILRYRGELLDDLSLSALIGQGRVDSTTQVTAGDCPFVQDLRGARSAVVGCWTADPALNDDRRRAARIDLIWNLGDHRLLAGVDREDNHSRSTESLAGDAAYVVYTLAPGDPIGNSGTVATLGGDYVEVIEYGNSGRFSERQTGLYLEDQWQVLPQLALRLGLRLDRYTSDNTRGQTLLDLRADPAPRLGLVWDLFGDGRTGLYAHFGRTSLPVGTASAVRVGANYREVSQAYRFNGYADDASQRPQLGTRIGGTTFGDGSVVDPRTAVARDVQPSEQEEWIVGGRQRLEGRWLDGTEVGLSYIHRRLRSTVEDVALDLGLNQLLAPGALPGPTSADGQANLQDCDGNGLPDQFACGFDFYFITNPGGDQTVLLPTDAASGRYDANGDGPLRALTVPAGLLGYDRPRRRYHGVELTFERSWERGSFVQGSYTWSQSYGNYEGIVNSTIRQGDVAITQDFDQPGLLEGANGPLANDRRHNLKLFGSLQLSPEWQLGFVALAQSGTPYSALGFFRDFDRPEAAYAQFSFYSRHPDFTADPEQPALVPRGSAGRTPWLYNVDLSLHWQPQRYQQRLRLGLDVFNVFDWGRATAINEISENVDATPSSAYRLPRDFQDPRALRLSLEYRLR